MSARSVASTAGCVISVCSSCCSSWATASPSSPSMKMNSVSGLPSSGVITRSAWANVSATTGSALAQVLQHVDVLRPLAGVEERDLARAAPAAEHAVGPQGAPHRGVGGLERLRGSAGLLGQLGGVAVVDGDAHRRAEVGRGWQCGCGRLAVGRPVGDLTQPPHEARVVGGADDERAPQRGLAGAGWPRGGRRPSCRHGRNVDVGERHPARAGAVVAPGHELLEHGVEVGPTEPERAHPGAPDATRRRVPRAQLGVHRGTATG